MRDNEEPLVDMRPANFAQAVTIEDRTGRRPQIHVGIVYGADAEDLDRNVGAIFDQYDLINGIRQQEAYRVSAGPALRLTAP